MIVSVQSAVLHILDSANRLPMLSEHELDLEDGMINTYITRHIEKVYDDAAHRKGEFKSSSGLKYHINEYKAKNTDIVGLSRVIANRLFDALTQTQDAQICDIIVCELIINESSVIGILKLDNKIGFTHKVTKDENGITNNLINHYAILPTATQRIGEYAFIDTADLSIRYKGSKYSIDGEKTDIFAELLLECEYELSSREAVNTVTKAAKKVTEENGGDTLETVARIKECVIDNIEEKKPLSPTDIAEHVFDGRPAMKEEFNAKLENSAVPDEIEVNPYVKKKVTSNIRLVTDTGVELSFPSEYYSNSEYFDIINNEDGTFSIQINKIGELINK